MAKLKVGYLSLVKGSWINDRLEGQRQKALAALGTLDVELVDCGALLQSEDQGREVLERFDHERVDVILAHFITFSLGMIVPGMAARLNVPVVFWSEPEPAMQGGRIAANSFCATNMNAHALWKLDAAYALVYGDTEQAMPKLADQFRVLACIKSLKSARVGSAGGRVPGFYTSNFNELELRKSFGVEVEGVTLLELVRRAESISGDELKEGVAELTRGCQCMSLDKKEQEKGGALLMAFRQLTKKYHLDAWSVRCWPEFSDLYGIGVCHLLGCLTGSGVPAACEGDVYGAVAMLIVEALSGQPSFFCDLISFDPAGDTGVFWHCGAAPVGWCSPGCQPKLGKHSIIDGGGVKGIASEFPLGAGPVTVIRIGDRKDGGYRLLTIKAEGLPTEQLLKGNPLRVRFGRPAQELVDTLVGSGFEHHYVMARGDITPLLRQLAKYLKLELLEL